MGKWVVLVGLVIAAFGLLTMGLERLGLRLGRLPGDIAIESKGLSIYIPLTTMLLVSALLTAISWIVGFLRK